MIGEDSISEILAVYRKHGWALRRVLLSAELSNKLGTVTQDLFEGAEIIPSLLDAMWFSRGSKDTLEAWELRHLSNAPYALVEVIERDTENNERDEVLAATELRMRDAVKRKN